MFNNGNRLIFGKNLYSLQKFSYILLITCPMVSFPWFSLTWLFALDIWTVLSRRQTGKLLNFRLLPSFFRSPSCAQLSWLKILHFFKNCLPSGQFLCQALSLLCKYTVETRVVTVPFDVLPWFLDSCSPSLSDVQMFYIQLWPLLHTAILKV